MPNAFKIRTSQAWWLKDACAPDVQAFIGGAFKHLPHGTVLLLALPEAAGGAWLAAAPATPASEPRQGQKKAATLALTAEGLRRSGLPDATLARFSAAFIGGMTQADRARRLGDIVEADGRPGTVHAGGLRWSGGAPSPDTPDEDRLHGSGHARIHAMLILYAATAESLAAEADRITASLGGHGVTVAHRVALTPVTASSAEPMREHYGFVDGISQPLPHDDPDEPESGQAIIYTKTGPPLDAALAWHRIRTGDIIFGRPDAYGERAGAIHVPEGDDDDPARALPQGTAPVGQRDLGWNGTYLVARELLQDVPGFWREMAKIGAAQQMTPLDLAEKIVGRTVEGDLLLPDGTTPSNDRGFDADDPHGFGCPGGAHIRRANPRDGGARDTAERATRLQASNNHRILRRGRPFGPPLGGGDSIGKVWEQAAGSEADANADTERGLFFLCVNTDIVRQFEFVQQTWLMNRRFAASGQTDPLVGEGCPYSIPDTPVRRRIATETHVRLVGGEYFFMPSIGALRWLATLPPPEPEDDTA